MRARCPVLFQMLTTAPPPSMDSAAVSADTAVPLDVDVAPVPSPSPGATTASAACGPDRSFAPIAAKVGIESLRCLIAYLYSGCLPLTSRTLVEVYWLAQQLELQLPMKMCQSYALSGAVLSSAARCVMALADCRRLLVPSLHGAIIEYMALHFAEYMSTAESNLARYASGEADSEVEFRDATPLTVDSTELKALLSLLKDDLIALIQVRSVFCCCFSLCSSVSSCCFFPSSKTVPAPRSQGRAVCLPAGAGVGQTTVPVRPQRVHLAVDALAQQ